MEDKTKLKMAIIAGAAHAISYKERNSKASEQEVLRHISREINGILQELDEKL